MKKITMFALAFLAIVALRQSISTADTAADDEAFINSHLDKLVKVHVTRIDAPAVGKVFGATILKVDMSPRDSQFSNSILKIARVGDDVVQITEPSETKDLPEMQKLIKTDFTLKSTDDAKVFQDALDAIYPVDPLGFDKEAAAAKKFKQDGKQWTFIRGTTYEKKNKGYVITVDDAGKVTGVKYSESL
jgi:hypothetical protein